MDVVASYYYNLYKHVASCVYIFISGLTNRDYLSFSSAFGHHFSSSKTWWGVQRAFFL